jgi:RNA polymerase sigma factor (sigma-70 family)
MQDSGDYRSDDELEQLLARLDSRLAAILGAFRIPPEDADDLLQDVLLQFVRKRALIRAADVWLPGALRNACRMYWRTRSRRFTHAIDGALLDLVEDKVERPPQESRLLRRNLAQRIARLDWRCRAVLRLRYNLGYEAREVANEMGYSPASIDKVTRRCLDALGRKLAAALPAPARQPRRTR